MLAVNRNKSCGSPNSRKRLAPIKEKIKDSSSSISIMFTNSVSSADSNDGDFIEEKYEPVAFLSG